jgi:hypothetical protein
LNLAWAELLAGFKSNIGIFVVGVLKDFIDIFGVSADADDFLLALSVLLGGDLLLVFLTLGHEFYFN